MSESFDAQTNTGSTGEAHVYEDGKRVYPCRCGETHRGDYAAYDYYHHNCFHTEPLWDLSYPYLPRRSYLMCPDCGEVFHVTVVSRWAEWRENWPWRRLRGRARYLLLHPHRLFRRPKGTLYVADRSKETAA